MGSRQDEFQESLSNAQPPESFSPIEKAVWWAAKDKWHKSHNLAQNVYNKTGSWLHAWLHRQEGDHSNASYWYDRAGKSFPEQSLQEELQLIIKHIFH